MNGMPEGWHEEYLFQPLFDAMRKKDAALFNRIWAEADDETDLSDVAAQWRRAHPEDFGVPCPAGDPGAIKQREGRQIRAMFEYDIRPLEQRIAPPTWDWRRTKRELRKIGLVRKGVRRN